jgi:hypothetical protein
MNRIRSSRRGVVSWGCLFAIVTALAVDSALLAQQPVKSTPIQASAESNRQGRQVSLFDQLRVGLKAKTDDDNAFLNLVVLKVNQGVLPRKMVDATFLWARNRYKLRATNHRLRPIVYFKPALTAQAKKIGVVL